MTNSSKRLRFSTLIKVAQSILFVAVVMALAVVVAGMIQQRRGEGASKPETERTAPSESYYQFDAFA